MNTLIFTGGLHPTKGNFVSAIKQCEPFDLTIAADSGFDTASEFKIECDIIVGDMDSIVKKDVLKTLANEKVLAFPKDKDFTDTELALFEAKKRGANHITLVGGDGGRLDHTLALLKVFEGDSYPDIWLCKEQIVYALDESKQSTKTFSLSENETISIFCVTKEGSISSQGLKWEINSVEWEKGGYSVSNRALCSDCLREQDVILTVSKGRFLVIVSYCALHKIK